MLSKYLLAAIGVIPLVAGCGGGGDTTMMGPGADLSFVAFKLDSGQYKVLTATATSDVCMLKLEDTTKGFIGSMLPLVVNHTNGMVSFGKSGAAAPDYTPMGPVQGSGTIDNNMGTLTYDGTRMISASCSYHVKNTNMVTVTADNTLSTSFSQVRTPVTGGCTDPDNCTSTYTITYQWVSQ